MKIILQNANIVNEGKISKNDLLINDDIIEKISNKITPIGNEKLIDIKGCFLLPGIIDNLVGSFTVLLQFILHQSGYNI
jgi:dihydroorotase